MISTFVRFNRAPGILNTKIVSTRMAAVFGLVVGRIPTAGSGDGRYASAARVCCRGRF